MSENLLATLATNITAHSDIVNAMERRAMQAVVDTDEAAAHCTDLIKAVGLEKKGVEAERKALVDPMNSEVKAINLAYKPVTASLDAAKKVLTNKLTDFQVEQSRIERARIALEQKAAEEAALAAAAKLEDEGQTEAASTVVDLSVAAAAKASREASAPVRGNLNTSSSLRTVRVFEVIDLAAIPVEYLMLNERAVRDAINRKENRITEIPGINIVETKKAVVR